MSGSCFFNPSVIKQANQETIRVGPATNQGRSEGRRSSQGGGEAMCLGVALEGATSLQGDRGIAGALQDCLKVEYIVFTVCVVSEGCDALVWSGRRHLLPESRILHPHPTTHIPHPFIATRRPCSPYIAPFPHHTWPPLIRHLSHLTAFFCRLPSPHLGKPDEKRNTNTI